MVEERDRRSSNLLLGALLGGAVVILGVLAYLYYEHVVDRPIVKIDTPGFSGEVSQDKGVDIEVGRDQP